MQDFYTEVLKNVATGQRESEKCDVKIPSPKSFDFCTHVKTTDLKRKRRKMEYIFNFQVTISYYFSHIYFPCLFLSK